jgi:hypothetical protein
MRIEDGVVKLVHEKNIHIIALKQALEETGLTL